MEEYLLTTEAARLLCKSAETVRLYERLGRLPALRTSSGVRLFRRADVLRLAESMKEETIEGAGTNHGHTANTVSAPARVDVA